MEKEKIRREELIKLCEKNKTEVSQLVDEIMFLEERLKEIKKLPFIKTNPKNNLQQKTLPAGKLYKDLLQQYNVTLKLFASLCETDLEDEESPLRKWVRKKNADTKQKNMDSR